MNSAIGQENNCLSFKYITDWENLNSDFVRPFMGFNVRNRSMHLQFGQKRTGARVRLRGPLNCEPPLQFLRCPSLLDWGFPIF